MINVMASLLIWGISYNPGICSIFTPMRSSKTTEKSINSNPAMALPIISLPF